MEELTEKQKEINNLLTDIERKQVEEKIRLFVPTPKQIEYHLSKKRSRWFLAGNRVGKTVSGGVFTSIIALGKRVLPYMVDWPENILKEFKRLSIEAPTEALRKQYSIMANKEYVNELVEQYRHIALNAPEKARIWVCSETYEVQRDVVQKEILGDPETLIGGWIPNNEIKGRPTYRTSKVIDFMKLKSGATIGFKSYDQGRRKFQGTSQHLIWEDEEPPEDIRSEIRMRLLDTEGIELGTMTPLSGLTHIYDNIFLNDKKSLDKQDPEVLCLTAGWDDNPHLSGTEKKRLESNMDESEIEARKHGHFIMPGKGAFNTKAIKQMLDNCYDGERGNLIWVNDGQSVEWQPDPEGDYEVWFHPNKEGEYLMAADVAEGLEHGDFDAVGVLNRHRCRLEAVFHGHVDADVLSDYIHRLAIYYNEPLAAPEGNNHGLTTISFLKQVYSNIYKAQIYDKLSNETRNKLGWYTTSKTRPLIVDAIKMAVREQAFECYWRRFVDEAMNFIRHPNGKEAARNGYWDDTVIMCGILVHLNNTMSLSGSGDSFMAGAGTGKHRHLSFDDDDDDDYDSDGPGFFGI